jgi:uroporphyrinogen decarboxylase
MGTENTMNKIIERMSREDVIKAVERKNPSRIPLVRAKWWGEGLTEQYGERLKELERYPEDVAWLWMDNPVDPDRMDLPWTWQTGGAHDSSCVIDDWAKLDDFIERLPDPADDSRFNELAQLAEKARADNRYLLFGWWNLFFERPWMLRGMENLLCDYYTEPENIHKLHSATGETYCSYIETAYRVLKPDGFFTSDDLGHQTGPMMGPEIFRDFLFPYYKHVGDTLKDSHMHFWLHSCGDNTLLLPDLIASGLTVFHPVQKHTMDEVSVASEFGAHLTFLAGIDVQHTLQEKDPDGVREEVRFLVDTFDAADGGMCIAAGNGIVAGTPFENIEAFLDEAIIYGTRHRNR